MSMTKEKKVTTSRQSNLELLRIIAMIMIIGHHYACHGGGYYYATQPLNVWISCFFMIGGKIGVNAFILITGYFMVQKKFDIHRLVKLELGVLFYSIVFFFVGVFVWREELFQTLNLLTSLFPSVTNLYSNYWFIPCYLGVILMAPFINKMISVISRRQCKTMIIVLLIFTVFFPGLLATEGWYDGNIPVFFIMYLIGAYVRTYNKELCKGKVLPTALLAIGSYLLLWVLTSNLKLSTASGLADLLWCDYGILTTVVAVFLFMTFKQMNIGSIRILNVISGATLGIYLIHDNNYVRNYIWEKVFLCPQQFASPTMWVHALKCIAIVFVVCTCIELVRSLIFKPLEYGLGKLPLRAKINDKFNGITDANEISKDAYAQAKSE